MSIKWTQADVDAFNAKKGVTVLLEGKVIPKQNFGNSEKAGNAHLLPTIPAADSRNSNNSGGVPGTIIIGIDPDIDKNGVCAWDRGKKTIQLSTLTFFQLFEYLQQIKGQIHLVKIEAGWKNAKNNFHGAKNASTAARIGANVGANHETGKKIVEMLQYLAIPYREVKPLKKTWKSRDGKISHEELMFQVRFRGLPEITGRTNQEQRDAALICFNG